MKRYKSLFEESREFVKLPLGFLYKNGSLKEVVPSSVFKNIKSTDINKIISGLVTYEGLESQKDTYPITAHIGIIYFDNKVFFFITPSNFITEWVLRKKVSYEFKDFNVFEKEINKYKIPIKISKYG